MSAERHFGSAVRAAEPMGAESRATPNISEDNRSKKEINYLNFQITDLQPQIQTRQNNPRHLFKKSVI